MTSMFGGESTSMLGGESSWWRNDRIPSDPGPAAVQCGTFYVPRKIVEILPTLSYISFCRLCFFLGSLLKPDDGKEMVFFESPSSRACPTCPPSLFFIRIYP